MGVHLTSSTLRTARRLGTSLVAVGVLLTITATGSSAEAPGSANTVVQHRVPQAEANRAADYWTPERMREAKPADRLRTTEGKPEQKPVPAAPAQDVVAPLAPTGDVGTNIYRTRTVGKIFFTDVSDGENYVCSGSVVNSPARNMAFTAGHCVHGGGEDNTWHDNVLFVPGYFHGDQPYGEFEAYNLVSLQGWTIDDSFGYDSALILLNTNDNGQRLIDAVGGYANGLTTGGPFEQHHVVIGYPGDQEDGQNQYYCEGPSEQATVFFPRQITMSCGLGGGSSGGPWLLDYDDWPDGTGVGMVHGGTSNNDIFGNLRSPYYTPDAEGNMYRTFANG